MPSKDEGQGQTIGIFMEGVTASVVANLRVFEQRMNLPEVPVTVVPAPNPSDTTGPTDNSGGLEWDLDSDASTGMAPLVSATLLLRRQFPLRRRCCNRVQQVG